jgi:hypothetical protein
MKAHIQQENEELLMNNDEQINITNDDYDQIVQLPINNQARYFQIKFRVKKFVCLI